jgi:hypothetical protein
MCGAVRYEVSADPVGFASCHCRECQFVSGGAPAHIFVVLSETLRITKGAVKRFTSLSKRGNEVHREFCEACGTPMFAGGTLHPEVRSIKVGTLDDPSWVSPGAQIWTRTRQPWAHDYPELPQFEEDPVV